ncbi:nitroreductase family protein [Mycolicibacterium tusciae]|nr:nitroreductase family protein [Mycolicibacterium tusciae]
MRPYRPAPDVTMETGLPSDFPDTATLQRVLELAAWAPSARNSQPWRWEVDGSGLHLDADWDRAGADTEADRRDVLLGCGSILNHCAVSLAAAGWQARIRRFPDDGHVASFELIDRAPTDGVVELATAIPRRRSDRRDYAASPLPPSTLELLLIRAARYGVQMSVVPKLHWMRLPEGAIRLRYGGDVDDGPRPGAADGTLLVLATETDDDTMRLRAGEALSHLLLSATVLGLASCALTEPIRDMRERLALACELFDAGAHPQTLIRLGPTPANAVECPVPSRRSVAETTVWTV